MAPTTDALTVAIMAELLALTDDLGIGAGVLVVRLVMVMVLWVLLVLADELFPVLGDDGDGVLVSPLVPPEVWVPPEACVPSEVVVPSEFGFPSVGVEEPPPPGLLLAFTVARLLDAARSTKSSKKNRVERNCILACLAKSS